MSCFLPLAVFSSPASCPHAAHWTPWGPRGKETAQEVTCPDDRQRHEELAQQQLLAEDLLQALLPFHGEALEPEPGSGRSSDKAEHSTHLT